MACEGIMLCSGAGNFATLPTHFGNSKMYAKQDFGYFILLFQDYQEGRTAWDSKGRQGRFLLY